MLHGLGNDPQAELTGSGGETEGLLLARVHDYHKILVTHTRAVKFEMRRAPGQKSHIYQLAYRVDCLGVPPPSKDDQSPSNPNVPCSMGESSLEISPNLPSQFPALSSLNNVTNLPICIYKALCVWVCGCVAVCVTFFSSQFGHSGAIVVTCLLHYKLTKLSASLPDAFEE